MGIYKTPGRAARKRPAPHRNAVTQHVQLHGFTFSLNDRPSGSFRTSVLTGTHRPVGALGAVSSAYSVTKATAQEPQCFTQELLSSRESSWLAVARRAAVGGGWCVLCSLECCLFFFGGDGEVRDGPRRAGLVDWYCSGGINLLVVIEFQTAMQAY